MGNDRIRIPEELATRVLFASDRTCCVCRLERHKVQIHHIDEDPSNNDFENLAVVCLNCHSDAHTPGAFVRSLTSDLIRLYNSSWREIVRFKLAPLQAHPLGRELLAEVLLEASLDCHYWKVLFMRFVGNTLPGGKPGEFQDVWDLFAERWVPNYTESAFRDFMPLFEGGLSEVRSRYDRLNQSFSDILPLDFRTLLMRARRQLETEQVAYRAIPLLCTDGEPNIYFAARFTGVIRVLCNVSRDADRRRELLSTSG